jgi:hemerythrin
MAAIDWNPKTMATGMSVVDAQHQEWLRRYNNFDEAISQGRGPESIKSTLDFFIAYTDIHFKFEEELMEKRRCAAASANHADHEQMRQMLSGFSKNQAYSVNEIIGLKLRMKEWLLKHILTIDIQLRNL